MNQIDLAGQVAVVTGGAQGIGLAITRRLVASGARVGIWDSNADVLATAKDKLGDHVSCIAVDITEIKSPWTHIRHNADRCRKRQSSRRLVPEDGDGSGADQLGGSNVGFVIAIQVTDQGRTLFEGEMAPGQRFEVPQTATAPLLRVGAPQALRITVGTAVVPPVGPAGQVTSNVSLRPADLTRAQPAAGAAQPAAPPPPAR